jgi:N-acetylglucosaminyldiphosphoundecaprenol N-acetyl-beta-D-mannosaminyltransferase
MSNLIPKSNVAGVSISKYGLTETLKMFCCFIDNKEKRRICVTPVNNIVWANQDKKLLTLYNTSDMNLADGVPVVWASRFLNDPIHGRVTGLDVLPEFSKISASRGYTSFYMGAKEGVAESLKENFIKKYPGLKIAGVYSPPFAKKFTDIENEKIIAMINDVRPDILWVSLTSPKQDFWIAEHFHRLNIRIAIGVGGAFEVCSGIIDRSPLWMQRNGLEWFYRFLKEPRRLFRRYFLEAPVFFILILRQKLGMQKQPSSQYDVN